MDNDSVSPTNGTVQFESAFQLMKPSRHALGLNLGTIVGLILTPIVLVIIGILVILVGFHGGSSTASAVLAFVLGVLFYAFCILVGIASIYVLLESAKGQHISTSEALKAAKPFFWRFFGLGIILAILECIGLILLVFPFFLILKRYFLVQYYMLDRNLSIGEAMKQCAADSKKYSGAIWGIMGVQFLIGLCCIIPVLGSIVTVILAIMYSCAPAIRYLEISRAENSSVGQGPAGVPQTNPMPPVINPQPPQAPMPPAPQSPTTPRRPLVQ